MMRILLATLLILLLCAPWALADEGTDRFMTNPLRLTGIGDPFILAAEEEYLIFATGGKSGFFVRSASRLDDKLTTRPGMRKTAWADSDYWAPEVWPWQERYAMLFTARRTTDRRLLIGLAFSDRPEGPYEDALGGPLFDFGYAAIDATLTQGPDGTPYLIYSRDCSQNIVDGRHESHLYGVQLTEDLTATVGEPVLLTVPDAPWEQLSGDYRWNEGPAVLIHEGRYYLFYSANYYASQDYAVGVAVADSPLGPYVKQANNPILRYVMEDGETRISGPGHNSFFRVGDELFTAYHVHTKPEKPSGNRQLCVDRVGFHADGTAYICGPSVTQLRPLAEMGLRNVLPLARTAVENALLTDGDTCVAPSSASYVWRGDHAVFAWDEPVPADQLILWPVDRPETNAQVTVNGEAVGTLRLSGSEPATLSLPGTVVTELSLQFDAPASLGEVMLLGPEE